MKNRITNRLATSLFIVVFGSGCATLEQGAAAAQSYQDTRQLNPDYKMAIAKTAYQNNRYDEAIELYQEVIDQDESNVKATSNISAIYLDLGMQGMQYAGQAIRDKQDAELARNLYEDITRKTHEFFRLLAPHVAN